MFSFRLVGFEGLPCAICDFEDGGLWHIDTHAAKRGKRIDVVNKSRPAAANSARQACLGVGTLGAIIGVTKITNRLPGATFSVFLVDAHCLDSGDIARTIQCEAKVDITLELSIGILWFVPARKSRSRIGEDRTTTEVGIAFSLVLEKLGIHQWLNRRARLDKSSRRIVLTKSGVGKIAAADERNQLTGLSVFDCRRAVSKAGVVGAINIPTVTIGHFAVKHGSHTFFEFRLDIVVQRGFDSQATVADNCFSENFL